MSSSKEMAKLIQFQIEEIIISFLPKYVKVQRSVAINAVMVIIRQEG